MDPVLQKGLFSLLHLFYYIIFIFFTTQSLAYSSSTRDQPTPSAIHAAAERLQSIIPGSPYRRCLGGSSVANSR